jgi:glycosyltransferase involved in cell wall biosynthesis
MSNFSVLIPLYDKDLPAQFIEAIESVWCYQTLKPSQIVVVVDGPVSQMITDAVSQAVGIVGDDVIDVVWLEENCGLGHALNLGIERCRYDLIARMDSDDISLRDRFEKQFFFMEANPDVAASSGYVEEWDVNMSVLLGIRKVPLGSTDIRKYAKRRCPLSHPASMIRKSAVLSVGGYPPLRRAQDYALWSVLLQEGQSLRNIDSVLVRMRVDGSVSRKRGFAHFKCELMVLRYQRSVGFIGYSDFLVNLGLRAVLRLSPSILKQFLYRVGR